MKLRVRQQKVVAVYFPRCFAKANVFIGLGLTSNVVASFEAFHLMPYLCVLYQLHDDENYGGVVIRIDYYRSVLFFHILHNEGYL